MGTQSRCNKKLNCKMILRQEWGHKVDEVNILLHLT